MGSSASMLALAVLLLAVPGGAVQVEPIKPKLKPPGTKRLKLQYAEPPATNFRSPFVAPCLRPQAFLCLNHFYGSRTEYLCALLGCLLAVAITWIAVHLSERATARGRHPESPEVPPADPACVRGAVRALQHSNFHADIVSAGTICRRDATVAVREGRGGEYVGFSGGVTLAADVEATAATIVIMVGRCRLTLCSPTPPGTDRLTVKCDIVLSTSDFKFNLRCYIMGHSVSRANANYVQIFTQYLNQVAKVIESVVFVWANQKEAIPPYVKWLAAKQGLTLVHFSAQPESFLTPITPYTPPIIPRHLPNTSPKHPLCSP